MRRRTLLVGTLHCRRQRPGAGRSGAAERTDTASTPDVWALFPRGEDGFKTDQVGDELPTDDQYRFTVEPHELVVGNADTESRDAQVDVETTDGDTLLETTVTIPETEAYRVVLRERRRYDVTVQAEGTGESDSFRIPKTYFDCNDSEHLVTLEPDGTVTSTAWTEQVACGPVTASPTSQ